MQIDRGTSLTGYLSRTHLRLVLFAHTVGLNGFMPDAHEGTMMTHMFSGAAWGGGKSHGAPHPPRSEWLCVCLCVCVCLYMGVRPSMLPALTAVTPDGLLGMWLDGTNLATRRTLPVSYILE